MSQPETAALALEKARRYLDTADLVRRHGDYDSAVSRLYYAMFYCAEALLLMRGLTFAKHQAVIAAFGQQFARTKLLPPDLHRWLLVRSIDRGPLPDPARVVGVRRVS